MPARRRWNCWCSPTPPSAATSPTCVTPTRSSIPPGLTEDCREISRIRALAGDMVVCFGYAEAVTADGREQLYNAALCVTGDGILGRHRKVHQPAGESLVYAAGDTFAAFDTPGGPARHADRLRQDVPRGGPVPRP